MHYETVVLDITDGLAVLTLNRPDKMNALTTQMRAEITHAMKDAATRARCIVITGAGPAFCSGQDLGDASSTGKIDLERSLRDEYEPMLETIHSCPVPTIAAVNGAAAGAGANLALCADVVIATESAYFLQAFARIGLLPDAGGTWFMPRQMGLAKAMGAALFADKISAQQADDWGLIWESVPDDNFAAHWRKRAEYLANGPTAAYGAIKQAIRGTYENTLPQQLATEAHLQGECGRSRDFAEGVVAFMGKRPPKFEGR
ncbi:MULTISPECIES: enoyl-CoA hydratase-related protein [unclassified Ruegeria]|uniref:enoyl-CoA hydratase-related protein n=1 Tax=unclassified Ruegeria TaxID=2625375 RepID=UPI001489120B|nr:MULTISPECIES: enoyl-CoA hydratase-related protein [unclassified Ruegeria]NOD63432.1 2-(1,2-epoxy-1,2-dihydrophenyl)acetyl-CoA isomerase [Ruegeria sp. HKCCD6109]NOD75314.1 2-(1,2-epoxy-1,2-dihydrophenyl)acetyl-CoA isomerase [Ruegeria sp. HKCCD4332]NOD87275.1 2-(1,2-epoxy-1,2-dihydrophenyl)acetyl-CoA isomerase [Ruegeria sp. HKCCD4318]NOE12830.1 2-(1,2-epoxy-1,2-dihydrophenyl)acetyl-CoA isomerase [Ruegeria sp. HKCCD4318-2]NOG09003.1 2-(1,2-epoxy-1,2-dihydrophenyl)acetyl-CoA isomerase [Ruegeria